MGLIQTIIENSGIPTVSVSLLLEVTERVRPPRVLAVDRPLGYPLDLPDDPAAQRRVIEAALALTATSVGEPLVVSYDSGFRREQAS